MYLGVVEVEFFGAFADAEIVDRQYVGAAEREHEIHLDCPAADAARGCEAFDDFLVWQQFRRGFDQIFGIGMIFVWEECDHAAVNGAGGFAGELLVDD